MRGRTAALFLSALSVTRASHRLLPLATPLIQWEAPDDRIITFSLALMWAARGFCDSDTLSVVFLDFIFISADIISCDFRTWKRLCNGYVPMNVKVPVSLYHARRTLTRK